MQVVLWQSMCTVITQGPGKDFIRQRFHRLLVNKPNYMSPSKNAKGGIRKKRMLKHLSDPTKDPVTESIVTLIKATQKDPDLEKMAGILCSERKEDVVSPDDVVDTDIVEVPTEVVTLDKSMDTIVKGSTSDQTWKHIRSVLMRAFEHERSQVFALMEVLGPRMLEDNPSKLSLVDPDYSILVKFKAKHKFFKELKEGRNEEYGHLTINNIVKMNKGLVKKCNGFWDLCYDMIDGESGDKYNNVGQSTLSGVGDPFS